MEPLSTSAMNTGDVVLVMGVATTSIVTILNAWANAKNNRRAVQVEGETKQTLAEVHRLTNSTLTAANRRIDELEAIVKELLIDRKRWFAANAAGPTSPLP